jgi:hypothetical protein
LHYDGSEPKNKKEAEENNNPDDHAADVLFDICRPSGGQCKRKRQADQNRESEARYGLKYQLPEKESSAGAVHFLPSFADRTLAAQNGIEQDKAKDAADVEEEKAKDDEGKDSHKD